MFTLVGMTRHNIHIIFKCKGIEGGKVILS